MALRSKRDMRVQHQARQAQGARIEHTGFYPYVRQYIEWIAVNGDREPYRHRQYRALVKFVAWCEERSLDRPQAITYPILERYRRHLYYYRQADGQPLAIGSQTALLTPLKAFFKWLTRERHMLYNPASELQLPKRPKALPRTILSVSDIEQIMAAVDSARPEGVRDRAVLELLYSTGLRRMEVGQLTLYDLDFRRRLVHVRDGKGHQARTVPVGERALAWLDKYRQEVRPLLVVEPDGGALFLSDYGEAMTLEGLGLLVRRALRKAGFQVAGACHLFRHAMATHMLENGADIRFIQAMLGHRDLTSTEIYTRVSIEKLQQVHAATHPARLTRQAGMSTAAELLTELEVEAEDEADVNSAGW